MKAVAGLTDFILYLNYDDDAAPYSVLKVGFPA